MRKGDIVSQTEWTTFVPGGRRRIVADGEKLMLVQIEFDKGAVVATHDHPHEQATYVVSGQLEFTLAGTTQVLSAGQSVFIPSNVPHSVIAQEACLLLDAFSPPREDFRSK
jgi:quercetin dioxygenase-like cupin family protein